MAVLALLIAVGILGGLGALVYFLVRGGKGDDAFSSRTMLRAYLRLAYFASLVVFLIGSVNLLTAGFATAFGHDFSYQPPYQISPAVCPVPPPGASAAEQGSYDQCLKARGASPLVEPNDTKQQDDLIRGLSLMVTGLILGSGHRLGGRALETPAERRQSGLARTEMLLGTVAFGLVTIVALPLAAYSVLHHAILGNQLSSSGGSADSPGSALATAVVFLPAWLYYLATFVRRARRPAIGDSGTNPPAAGTA